MNVRDKINEIIGEYKSVLVGVPDGNASPEQHKEIEEIFDALTYYNTRLTFFGNDEIEGT